MPDRDQLLKNPWIDAASLPEAPLFEALNDPAGRRYVVGEGGYVDAEGGGENPLASARTMDAGPPIEAEPVSPEDAAPLASSSPVEAGLLARLVAADPADSIDVSFVLRSGETGMQAAFDRAMATGVVSTEGDAADWRSAYMTAKAERIAALSQDLVETIEAGGGTVRFRAQNVGILTARLPARTALEVVEDPAIQFAGLTEGTATPLADSDGIVQQDAAQIRQFVTNGYTGDFSSGRLVAAIVEPAVEDQVNLRSFRVDHGAWRDGDSTSTFRFSPGVGVTGKWQCILDCPESSAIASVATYPVTHPPGTHATNIAGIIFGDLTNSPPQVPSVAVADRERTSGFARETLAHFYLVDTDPEALTAAFDHIDGLLGGQLPPPADVVNASLRLPAAPICEGISLLSMAANTLYLDGVAVFAGAGNEEGSSTDCKVGAPADAIGAFAVAAHGNTSGNATSVRTAGLYHVVDNSEGSAWGGNATQGDNRSIIALSAPGPRTYRISPASSTAISSSVSTGKTSYATAVVTAAALDIMDYHMSGGSSWISAPGALYSAMLAMGDRQATSGKVNQVPDHHWGVGRLRVRLFGTLGLDSPFWWYHGVTCIGQGETWDFNLAGGIVPADIDAVKAAAYWYDHRQPMNVGAPQIANVNLSIRDSASVMAIDNDAYDNKAVVFKTVWPDNEPVILRLQGSAGVTGHVDPTCGVNQIAVYFLIFAEDSDRESPTYDQVTGVGIYPEHL